MEATEEIVKIFLEMEGYLVKTDNHFILGKNNWVEPDIIAIKMKGKSKCDLPKKIIGEVKSFGLTKNHIRKLYKPPAKTTEKAFYRFRELNDDKRRKQMFEKVEEQYGGGFQYVLFADKITPKYKKLIEGYLKKKKIKYFTHAELLKQLKVMAGRTYFDNAVLQVIRLQKISGE